MTTLTNIFSWIGIGEIIRAETTGFHSGWLVHAPWIQDGVYEKRGSLIGGIYIIPGDATMGIIMFDMFV